MTANQRIVVTGGAGYVGSVVTTHLLMNSFDVVVVDRLAAGGEALLGFTGRERFRLVAGDVRDQAVLDEALPGAAAVVHMAAIVGEPACVVDGDGARDVNLGGTQAVLEGVARHGIAKFVFVSTCSNYGVSRSDVLADEECPLNPLGIYAKSKVAAELLALRPGPAATAIVLRLGTICGLSPRMRFDLLVNEMARAAVLGEPLQVFAPEAWRPFLHIGDAARAVQWAVERRADAGSRRVYNVVGENYQKKDLVALVRKHFPLAVVDVTDKIPDARDYRADATRIRDEGGFTPRHSVEDAFLDVARAVGEGVFRDPRWPGHAAAPLVRE